MRLLKHPTRLLFFTGKGGVGKTSVACATAVALADQGKIVLLVSTDPASNLGQVFGVTIGEHLHTAIPGVSGLYALNINPEAAAQAYRDRIVGPVRDVLPAETIKDMEEQLSGACTTEIAAFDELTGLLADDAATEQYDHVLFDTAPTGHTLRLLQLPTAWSNYLDTNASGASCLGPLSGLAKQRQQYAHAVAQLANGDATTVVLVSRPQKASLVEADRTSHELATLGIAHQQLVINGIMPENGSDDPLALALREREKAAIGSLPASLVSLPMDQVPLQPRNVVGLDALRVFLSEKSQALPVPQRATPPAPLCLPPLSQLIDEIEKDQQGLVMVMGKGGVGKSTVSSNLALALAQSGAKVGLMDADIYGPSQHIMFGVRGDRPLMKEVGGVGLIVPIEKYGIKMMSIGLLIDEKQAVVWRGPMVSSAIRQFVTEVDWGELDYLIIDMPPGTGDIHLTIVQTVPVTGVIVVTTPQIVALADAKKGIAMFGQAQMKVPVIGLVENMSYFTPAELPNNKYYIFGKDGGKNLAEEFDIPFLGQIPIVESIREGGDLGIPAMVGDNDITKKAFMDFTANAVRAIAMRNANLEPTQIQEMVS